MKTKWFVFTMLFNFLMGYGNADAKEINDKKRVVHAAIRSATYEIERKYDLNFSGLYEQADHDNDCKYKAIGLYFSSEKYIPKIEARNMIIDITNIILEKLNTKEVQPYLTINPFTEKNILANVCVKLPTKNWDYLQISFFGNCQGNIFYSYDIPDQKYKTREEGETFQEAKKILEQKPKEKS